MLIRNETEKDFQSVEMMTRNAFYNIYVPGCYEHYLVHIMRSHKDFIKELDFVIEENGEIIGNIMYTKATLKDENGNLKDILTFGPVCVKNEYQRKGYGKALIEHSFTKAKELGYDTIVIFGDPANYVSRGFKCAKRYNVCLEGDIFPTAMMVKTFTNDALDGRKWYYYQSPCMDIDVNEAEKFDQSLEPLEKKNFHVRKPSIF